MNIQIIRRNYNLIVNLPNYTTPLRILEFAWNNLIAGIFLAAAILANEAIYLIGFIVGVFLKIECTKLKPKTTNINLPTSNSSESPT